MPQVVFRVKTGGYLAFLEMPRDKRIPADQGLKAV
jgi:hypothetical protein